MASPAPLPDDLARTPFTTATAHERGVGRGRLRGRDLASPLRGVHVRASGALTLRERCVAALLLLPSGVAFAGPTAALLLGAPLPRAFETGALHVAVARSSGGPQRRGIVVRRHRAFRIASAAGLPCTTPERTWCELASALGLDDLVAVGDFMLHTGLLTRASLEYAVTLCRGARGVARMREALPLLDGRAESRRESRLRVMLVRAGFTGFIPNLHVRVGRHRHRVDIAFLAQMVAIEYHGEYHGTDEQWRKDVTRKARLESAGWLVIEVTAEDLRDPADLIRRIRAALAARA